MVGRVIVRMGTRHAHLYVGSPVRATHLCAGAVMNTAANPACPWLFPGGPSAPTQLPNSCKVTTRPADQQHRPGQIAPKVPCHLPPKITVRDVGCRLTIVGFLTRSVPHGPSPSRKSLGGTSAGPGWRASASAACSNAPAASVNLVILVVRAAGCAVLLAPGLS